ncbi:MAG: hypothetical protein JWO00_271 [Candidatus Parcubacteria bacterium]|nr:hypothetical protein [Candidatus Parcubacteria bacterium]
MNKVKNRNTTQNVVITILITILCVVLLLYIERDLVYAKLKDWKLVPQPEHFTELYFNNYDDLPKRSVKGFTAAFSFTIHNMEGATMTYPYKVYFEYSSGRITPFVEGSITLADGESYATTTTHVFETTDLQGKVIVAIPTLNQEIDSILPNNN